MQLAVPTDGTHFFEALFRDEQAMGRAICLTSVAVSISNILGDNPKLRLTDWAPTSSDAFPLRRTQSWNSGQASPPKQMKNPAPLFGTGDSPSELLDLEGLKHPDRKVISLINIPLWDKARWKGAGFIEYPDRPVPPVLALLFRDRDAGASIFAGWRQDIGPQDNSGKLRITFITGIDRNNPAHYRLIVGTNVDWDALPEASHFVMVSRLHRMTPPTSANLDRFLDKFRRDGIFLLAPGHLELDETVPSFDPHLAISSSHLNVRPAWEIGEHDPDAIGIGEEDNVVIPEGVEERAVLRTLEHIKKRRKPPPEPLISPVGPERRIGRNDACPCGSGKKFKKCHGQ